jgi:ABC-type multidrug transport system ATPase subunit
MLSTYLHLGLGFLTFRLRGVPRKEINEVVEWGLKKLDLLQFADRPAGALSGGNKRKVSTAIALIGGPSLIFLVPM